MTTIACNRQEMAGDRWFDLDGVGFRAPKLWVHNGSIWSSAGNSGDFLAFQRWVLGVDKERPVTDRDSFCVLRLDASGIWYYDYSCEPVLMSDDHFAIGSGQLAALVLMDHGLSPHDAIVKIAQRDSCTRGPVDVVTLASIQKPKRRARKVA